MKPLLEQQLAAAAARLEQLHGSLALFALLRTESSVGWHVIVSAPWLPARLKSALEMILDALDAVGLESSDYGQISLVTPLEPDHPLALRLISLFAEEQKPARAVGLRTPEGDFDLAIVIVARRLESTDALSQR